MQQTKHELETLDYGQPRYAYITSPIGIKRSCKALCSYVHKPYQNHNIRNELAKI